MSTKKSLNKKINLEKLEARDIMTPRSMVKYLLLSNTKEEVLQIFEESKALFLPVCRKSLDNIVGVCYIFDFIKTNNLMDSTSKYKMTYLAENQMFFEVVNKINNHNTPMGVVVDEFGGCCGIVSSSSIMNFFSSFHIHGAESINRFQYIIPSNIIEGVKSNTIGGFIMEYLDKIPQEGDSFVLNNHQFTILEMSKNTIKSIALWVIKEN